MKKLFNSSIILVVLISACTKKVEEITPIDRITPDLVYTSAARAEAAVVVLMMDYKVQNSYQEGH